MYDAVLRGNLYCQKSNFTKLTCAAVFLASSLRYITKESENSIILKVDVLLSYPGYWRVLLGVFFINFEPILSNFDKALVIVTEYNCISYNFVTKWKWRTTVIYFIIPNGFLNHLVVVYNSATLEPYTNVRELICQLFSGLKYFQNTLSLHHNKWYKKENWRRK